MNYERIYSEFIADRLTKQPVKPAYFEKHHIVPRALGGCDDEENLIRLIPEDHFFAHLMLAKIHGGNMWAPVAFMVGGSRKDYKPTHSRIAHAGAKRAMANALSGENARQFDFHVHRLINDDGVIWEGRQSDMPDQLGISKSLANMVIKGRVKVAKGWSIPGMDRNSMAGEKHPMHKDDVVRFIHADGREFAGTQFGFHKAHGISKADACRLVKGVFAVSHGWSIYGNERLAARESLAGARAAERQKKAEYVASLRKAGLSNSSDKNTYSWRDLATGAEFYATKAEVNKRYGTRPADLATLFSGRQNKTKGVALAENKKAIQRREGLCIC